MECTCWPSLDLLTVSRSNLRRSTMLPDFALPSHTVLVHAHFYDRRAQLLQSLSVDLTEAVPNTHISSRLARYLLDKYDAYIPEESLVTARGHMRAHPGNEVLEFEDCPEAPPERHVQRITHPDLTGEIVRAKLERGHFHSTRMGAIGTRTPRVRTGRFYRSTLDTSARIRDGNHNRRRQLSRGILPRSASRRKNDQRSNRESELLSRKSSHSGSPCVGYASHHFGFSKTAGPCEV